MGNRGTLINHKNRCERDQARREREKEAGRERITSKTSAQHRTPSAAVGPPSLQLLFQRCGLKSLNKVSQGMVQQMPFLPDAELKTKSALWSYDVTITQIKCGKIPLPQ